MKNTLSHEFRVAIAQINPTVGAIAKNTKKIIEFAVRAEKAGAMIVVFPELAVTGYPPEDLVLKHYFVEQSENAVKEIAKRVKNISVVVGFIRDSGGLRNSAAYIEQGKIKLVYDKTLLPNESVFDEKRYFVPGDKSPIISTKFGKIAINICEDVWHTEGPTMAQVRKGAKIIINISASPFFSGKLKVREQALRDRIKESPAVIAYINLVGGQDELVFDGASFIMNPKGEVIARAKQFEEQLLITDFHLPLDQGAIASALPKDEEIFEALVLATRDYFVKNGFKKALIGLSGGIDSSLVAAIAVQALGRTNVAGITMPSQYSSKETKSDAFELAKNLGIKIYEVPIRDVFMNYLGFLNPHFKGKKPDVTEENLQARIRGNILMAFANKFRYLVLTTGNKSETSVGFATLYGDTAGGFAPIKDVYKTHVFRLSEYVNKKWGRVVIPRSVIKRPPTPELKDNQKDEDTLPPYPILDKILELYIEHDLSAYEIVKKGFNKETVSWVIQRIDTNEYKRRQAAPGVKITHRAFGKDRRMPITNQFDELSTFPPRKKRKLDGRPKG